MNKTKNSKIVLVLSVFLIFLIIGSASAAEDTDEIGNETILTSTMDVDTVTNTVDQVSAAAATDSVGSSDTGNELLQSDDNIKTFDDLKTEISSSTGDTIVLTGKYYKYTGTTQNNNAISITKTIDGNGAIIDGNNLARVFMLKNQNYLAIKNINFINTYINDRSHVDSGSAINIQNCIGILIENCTFNNRECPIIIF